MPGSWGEITGAIANNGARPDRSTQLRLKGFPDLPAITKQECDDLSFGTLVGHSRDVLTYGYKNFYITVNDPTVRKIAVQRLPVVNEHATSPRKITYKLAQYFPSKLRDTIAQLPFDKQMQLYEKKYVYDKPVQGVAIDLSCVFDKTVYLDLLSQHFTFDKNTASDLYDDWFRKQQSIGFVL